MVLIAGTVCEATAMGKKRDLRKQMRKRELEATPALVICVGKRCCAREESRAIVEVAREYAGTIHAHAAIVTVGCLDVCKHGPIAATYPEIKFKKRVTAKRVRKLVDRLEGRRR